MTAPLPLSQPCLVQLPATPARVEDDFLNLGQFNDPARPLHVNSRHLSLKGRPWLPVMGEFHYSRYPADEWATELRRMHAGGVDVVASYVFWNHHEAREGQFDWQGQRDLRRFVELVRRMGMAFYLRPGPWVHSESRHGGFPRWLLPQQPGNGPVRCNDPQYLQRVARFFGQIGQQLHGLLWQDGGPVIGVQLENEYDGTGPGRGAEHIAELKRIAIEAGLRVPLYTVTGWPTLDIPPREVLPVSGAYPDGFWQADAGPLPPSGVFLFNTERAIGEMGNVGGTPAQGLIDKTHYPFFLAEAGGGMHVSWHRRPVIEADDVAATALVQIGSGATLYGYYMYHGGTNPDGPHGRVQETQASGYPNDVPVYGYDFRAPLGQYGQQRDSYGRLRCLHLFLRAFGAELAPTDAVLPANAPRLACDREQVRVALRGAGDSGFVFVNHHVRHHPLPQRSGFQVAVTTAHDGTVHHLPQQPMTLQPGQYFIWPVGQQLGQARLHHATLQVLTRWHEGPSQTWALFTLPGVPAELCFDAASVHAIDGAGDWLQADGPRLWLRPGELPQPRVLGLVDAAGQRHRLVLMSQPQADACAQLPLHGRERLVWAPHGAWLAAHDPNDGHDGQTSHTRLQLRCPADQACTVQLFPADDLALPADATGRAAPQASAEALASVVLPARSAALGDAGITVLRDQQQPPTLVDGPYIAWRQRSVPQAPDDAEFEQASEYLLQLPEGLPAVTLGGQDGAAARCLLAIRYIGDSARLYADGRLVDDHFNDGEPWLVGIDRLARQASQTAAHPAGQPPGWPRLTLRIVAAAADAPVFLEARARQRQQAAGVNAGLQGVSVQAWTTHTLNLSRHPRPTDNTPRLGD